MTVRVQEEPFDPGAEMSDFTLGRKDLGAIVTFTGLVRDSDAGDLRYMEIEHYPGMTPRAIEELVAHAIDRWALGDALVIHRHGRMVVGEAIMMVATAAPHRGDAFAAADFLMDYLKSRAPFWKKEVTSRGEGWVTARDDDEAALIRWS